MSDLTARIAADLLVPHSYALRVIRSAPHRYKTYPIQKRGGRGVRIIAQPAREVKRMQYWVLENVLAELPVHTSATAYNPGSTIKANAEIHASRPYLVKLDFADFFPSIVGEDFRRFIERELPGEFADSDRDALARILFWCPKGEGLLRLSIGAPSSPRLSNLLMYDFDSAVTEACSERGLRYSRYADDLTFSSATKELRGDVIPLVEEALERIPWPTLSLNNAKTFFGSKACRRRVTGLILTNDGEVSLGREKKRLLRAQIHRRHVLGIKDPVQDTRLEGMIAFARSIEPEFIERLEEKFDVNLKRAQADE